MEAAEEMFVVCGDYESHSESISLFLPFLSGFRSPFQRDPFPLAKVSAPSAESALADNWKLHTNHTPNNTIHTSDIREGFYTTAVAASASELSLSSR